MNQKGENILETQSIYNEKLLKFIKELRRQIVYLKLQINPFLKWLQIMFG